MKRADKFLIGIVVGVVIIVIIAFTITLLKPKPTYQSEDTPEGVAHNYLLALQKEEFERAYGYLSPSLPGYPRDALEFQEQVDHYSWNFNAIVDATLAVDDSKIIGNRATVTIRETRFYGGGLFESSQRISTFEMELHRENGEWKITDSDGYFVYCWGYEQGCR
jgi:hypothetical protein